MTHTHSEFSKGGKGRWQVLSSQLLNYAVALLSVALALGINFLFRPYLDSTPTPLFFTAVMVSAWYGGLGAGLLATALSALAIHYFLLEPFYSLHVPNLETLLQLGVFVIAAILINSLHEAQRMAQQKAEASLKSLQESEAKLRCLAESSIMGIVVAELSGPILEANDVFLEMLGYTQEELHSGRMRWRELTTPESLAVSEQAVQELLTTGVCQPFEKEYIRKDGSRVPVLHGAVMMGKETVIGFVLDITNRKQAEESLRQSEERLRVALKNSPITVFNQDHELRYTWVYNPALEYNESQVIGNLDADLLSSEDAAVLTQIKRRVLKTGVGEQQEVKLTIQGQDFYYDLTVEPLPNADGEIVGVTCASINITKLKQTELALRQSEERLRLAIEGAQLGTWDVDLLTGKAIWSEQHFKMLGYEPVATGEASEQMWISCIHPDDVEQVSQEWQKSRQEDRFYRTEYRVIRADNGEISWLAALGSFTYDENGQAIRSIGVLLDISDRKKAEIALTLSESRFRLIAETIQDVFWMTDFRIPKILYVSPAYQQIWGRSPQAIYQNHTAWAKTIHPDDRERVLAAAAICQKNNTVEHEYRIIRPDGTVRWIRDRGFAVHDQVGEIQQVIGIAQDITADKLASEALRRSEERFRISQEISLDAFTILDSVRDQTGAIVDFIWNYVNPKAAEILQRPVEELVGQRLLKVLPGNKINSKLFERYVRVVETGEPHDLELSYNADGITGWFRNMAVKLDDGVAISFTDITGRKQIETALRESEERLRLALTAANQGLYDLNVQTGDTVVSPEYARMLGYDPDEFDETNAKWRKRLHPDDVGLVSQTYKDYIAGKLDTYRVEFRLRTKSGDWKWILSIGNIVSWDSDGKPLRMLGTHTDITSRKHSEAERERLLQREQAAREQAETANRIKDEFLAVLSHELRSPLNPILGWSKLLQSGKLDQKTSDIALETIERNAKLQTQLIDDLLDVSRILRGKLVLNTCPVNMVAVVESALETVHLAAETKHIHIQTIINLDHSQVFGDAARLHQIIWNLLSNAVKFTPNAGKVEIRFDQIGSYLQIQVQDTGKGINPDFLPYVFEYFRQEDGTTTRKFGGLGLGLAIVRHLTELHGGTIQAHSPGEGQGATFTLQLPLMPRYSPINQNSEQPQQLLNLQGIKVLVVDDDKDAREFVAFLLEQEMATVMIATSANEAIKVLTRFKPNILLSDIGMPDMDGYMLIQKMRALPPEQGGLIPAIALTAYAGEYNQQQALKVGFQKHISKPVEPETLVKVISELIC
ncbi:PAS domain S-box protein [Sphaerospermopsis aphanizomenoides BCCUSP55]|uniref:hybrid sensor histidine kinase/response regulator n=1 Tax=Sphaerospermopsis aphanizomenoides TaxID=459663 RepID=UPI0019064945|nr:PAS domain S-box protein [Sphaerospermopsis aphanizomenoides]MBK1989968.1 PAS domain S-box protein [Sphaerospermopsis aphanizomenoides BCCUSP55]